MVSRSKLIPWRTRARRTAHAWAAAFILTSGVGLAGSSASVAATAQPHKVCRGELSKPGILQGVVSMNVVVRGACAVKDGSATVKGSVTVTRGSTLLAISGHNDRTHRGNSNLIIIGNLDVEQGATAILGCEAAHSPCVDDNQRHPRLNNKILIGDDVLGTEARAVILHETTVVQTVAQIGGGGGEGCRSRPGVFKRLKSPVFSDYEDDTIGGDLAVTGLRSCWLGILRDNVTAAVVLEHDKLADPDAIEVGANKIGGNLACIDNTMAWDTVDSNPAGTLYPRTLEANTVALKREGACVRSTPTTKGGPYGAPGSF